MLTAAAPVSAASVPKGEYESAGKVAGRVAGDRANFAGSCARTHSGNGAKAREGDRAGHQARDQAGDCASDCTETHGSKRRGSVPLFKREHSSGPASLLHSLTRSRSLPQEG
eukprot:6208513-Pleurochrysis_carterae.AAC.3